MLLDPVHDTQKAFRKLMRANAFPGEVASLASEAERIDIEIPFNKAILLLALTLLDAETSFYAYSPRAEGDGQLISQMTYARLAEPAASDFIFVMCRGQDLSEVFAQARSGTLVDPHLGATIVIEVSAISDAGPYALSGPGIKGERPFGIDIDPRWLGLRAKKNAEFPIGVDIVFVDPEYRVAALPRTTRVREA